MLHVARPISYDSPASHVATLMSSYDSPASHAATLISSYDSPASYRATLTERWVELQPSRKFATPYKSTAPPSLDAIVTVMRRCLQIDTCRTVTASPCPNWIPLCLDTRSYVETPYEITSLCLYTYTIFVGYSVCCHRCGKLYTVY